MSIIRIAEQDIVFLSYDEPNAERNNSDLFEKCPWVKRVHGVKGSDAAHKACPDISQTRYFVTVDADNIVDPSFFNVQIDLNELKLDDTYVFSWCGRNYVNGLMYGNGGLKLWTKEFVYNMKTHEAAEEGDDKSSVEFCFSDKYYQLNDCFSTSYTNYTPFQAWRAGFREGVKMSLNEGKRVSDIKTVWWQNYQRLLVWCNIGLDVDNGIYSLLGARQGCFLTNCTPWDYSNVKDFDYLTELWNSEIKTLSLEQVKDKLVKYGDVLKEKLGLEIAEMDADASRFFKTLYVNSPRIIRTR